MADSGQQKQTVLIIVAVVILLGSLLWIMRSSSSSPRPSGQQRFFYDLTSGQLFTGPLPKLPPIDAAGGPGKGVGAVVLTCGACSESERQIGYLESYSDKAKAGLAALTKKGMATPETGRDIEAGSLVAQVPDKGQEPQWVVKTSAAGQKITQVELMLCKDKGKATQRCLP